MIQVAAPKALSVRVGLYFAFLYAKQPLRIRQVLNKVYVDNTNVDDDLVRHHSTPLRRSLPACVRRVGPGNQLPQALGNHYRVE